ncbi:MAG: pyrroline-5-carboxylate reductase [Clostridiales bacterium]|nr:pyrroline-5-carboxylate reductase [Clostridiales bacterium]
MKIGFLGIGNMGGAILSGFARSSSSSAHNLLAFDKSSSQCEEKQQQIEGLTLCKSGSELMKASDIAVLGVKPQIMKGVLEEIAPACHKDMVVVSMAAGISLAFLEKHLGMDAKIVRIMPNTPAMVGEAMVAVCRNSNVDDEDFALVMDIFNSVGKAEEVDESLIDCVIGVSGSSPAYTYMYIQALAEAAEANGMEPDKARIFAAQAVLGAAKMALESRESVEQLRINVCSPNGTTIEAVDRLIENGFMEDVKEGFQAAVNRSMEMTKEKN